LRWIPRCSTVAIVNGAVGFVGRLVGGQVARVAELADALDSGSSP
jgi:hypothetical protein